MRSLIRLVFWGLLWIPAWFITNLIRHLTKKPRLDNCLTWAVRKWESDGGYLVIRWARSAKYRWMRWPHFLWLPEDKHQDVKHFLPKVDDQHMKLIPNAWFEGKIQTGDPPDVLEN